MNSHCGRIGDSSSWILQTFQNNRVKQIYQSGKYVKEINNKKQFSSLLDECTGALYQSALRLTRNAADAEDLVAEAVIKAWSAFEKLEDKQRFRPWLFRILNNCYISHYRKKIIRPVETSYNGVESDHETDDEVISLLLNQSDEFLSWWANPEKEFANKILGNDILTAIESLPEAYRIAVILVNVGGLSYDEAADSLDVPPGTIRSRMKRGRTLLQKALWQHGIDAGLIVSNKAQEYTA